MKSIKNVRKLVYNKQLYRFNFYNFTNTLRKTYYINTISQYKNILNNNYSLCINTINKINSLKNEELVELSTINKNTSNNSINNELLKLDNNFVNHSIVNNSIVVKYSYSNMVDLLFKVQSYNSNIDFNYPSEETINLPPKFNYNEINLNAKETVSISLNLKFIVDIKEESFEFNNYNTTLETPELIYNLSFIGISLESNIVDYIIKNDAGFKNKLDAILKSNSYTNNRECIKLPDYSFCVNPLNNKIIKNNNIIKYKKLPLFIMTKDMLKHKDEIYLGFPGYNNYDLNLCNKYNIPFNYVTVQPGKVSEEYENIYKNFSNEFKVDIKNYNDNYILINSSDFDYLSVKESKKLICLYLNKINQHNKIIIEYSNKYKQHLLQNNIIDLSNEHDLNLVKNIVYLSNIYKNSYNLEKKYIQENFKYIFYSSSNPNYIYYFIGTLHNILNSANFLDYYETKQEIKELLYINLDDFNSNINNIYKSIDKILENIDKNRDTIYNLDINNMNIDIYIANEYLDKYDICVQKLILNLNEILNMYFLNEYSSKTFDLMLTNIEHLSYFNDKISKILKLKNSEPYSYSNDNSADFIYNSISNTLNILLFSNLFVYFPFINKDMKYLFKMFRLNDNQEMDISNFSYLIYRNVLRSILDTMNNKNLVIISIKTNDLKLKFSQNNNANNSFKLKDNVNYIYLVDNKLYNEVINNKVKLVTSLLYSNKISILEEHKSSIYIEEDIFNKDLKANNLTIKFN